MQELLDGLARIWERALDRHPVADPWAVLATGAVALVLVAHPASWRRVRLGVTVVHEAGHALVAVLTGRRLSGIRLHGDTSGVTVSRGRPRGAGVVLTLLAGYLAPGVLGLTAALLLAAGRPLALLWLLVAALVVLLVWIRNLYGLLTVVGLGAALAGLSWYAGPGLVTTAAYLLAWLLLLAAPRPVLELLGRGPAGRRGSDPDQLARLTGVPALAWIGVLLLGTLAGLAVGIATLAPDIAQRFPRVLG